MNHTEPPANPEIERIRRLREEAAERGLSGGDAPRRPSTVARLRGLSLTEWGGLAAMVMGTIPLVTGFLLEEAMIPPAILAMLLQVLVFVALWRMASWGTLGKVGLSSAISGTVLLIVSLLLLWADLPRPVQMSVGTLVLRESGLVILGIANLKTKALPRWNGVLLLMGLLLPMSMLLAAGLVEANLLRAILWIFVGYAMWQTRHEEAEAVDSATGSP